MEYIQIPTHLVLHAKGIDQSNEVIERPQRRLPLDRNVHKALYDAGCICNPVDIPFEMLIDNTAVCRGCRTMAKVR